MYGMNGWNKGADGDLISRAEAIDDLHGKDPSQIWDTADIEVWVNALPSAQPEIVRCKDCKWFNDIGCAIYIVDDSDKPTENDYCSYAERREVGE